jgi:hypothetical protein
MAGLKSLRRTGRETAGPSTPLRSGRDDNSVARKWSQKRSDEWMLIVQQNCHPDRSAAEWRDLRFLFRFSADSLAPPVQNPEAVTLGANRMEK